MQTSQHLQISDLQNEIIFCDEKCSLFVVNMKFLLILFVIIPLVSYTQFSISPVLGIDFMRLQRTGYDGPETITILDNGFTNGSKVLGLEIGYRLSDEIKISSNASYTNKQFSATREANFFDIKGIKFDYFTSEMNVRYFFSKVYVSAGFEIGFIRNMQHKYQTAGLKHEANIKGFVFGTGIHFNRFNINAYYFAGLHDVDIDKYILLAPVKSIGVYVAYELITTGRSYNKAKCPRF